MSGEHSPERPIIPTGQDDKNRNKHDDGKPENEKQDESSGPKGNKKKNKKDDDTSESSDDEMPYREWKAWKKEQKEEESYLQDCDWLKWWLGFWPQAKIIPQF